MMDTATPAGRGVKGSALPASFYPQHCPNCGESLRPRRVPTLNEQAAQAVLNAKALERAERGARMRKMRSIAGTVAAYYRTSLRAFTSEERTRNREVDLARHVAMYLLYMAEPDVPIAEIGRLLHRDRSTVFHGIKRVERDMQYQGWIREDVTELSNALGIAA